MRTTDPPITTTDRPPASRPPAAARRRSDPVAPPVAPRRLPPDRLLRYRVAGRGQPQPRSNALPPNQKGQARGRREPRRLPAAPAASQRHPCAAARPHTSRPQWPAVGWRPPPRRGRGDSARGSPPGPPIWWRHDLDTQQLGDIGGYPAGFGQHSGARGVRLPSAGPVRYASPLSAQSAALLTAWSTPTIVRAAGQRLRTGAR